VISRNLTILLASTLLVSCTGSAGLTAKSDSTDGAVQTSAAVRADAEACRVALGASPTDATRGLDQTRVRLLNWNTQKNTSVGMQADLARLTEGVDLILLQEAVRQSDAFAHIANDYHWSFSPGYRTESLNTGVMTASRIEPLAQCNLTHSEPWLQSPKATGITEFALTNTDETLLVINVHLINFTLGVDAMRQQLLLALSFAEQHQGPVIISGDFNTWRKARRDLVADALSARGFEPAGYADDYRKRFFGNPLDHTFVRGLRVTSGTSFPVETSDHNPTSVTLEF